MGVAGVTEAVDMVAITLRDLRRMRNWTQEDLAARAGVEQSQVSAWEGGRRRPSMENVGKLADGFGMRHEELARLIGYLDDDTEEGASRETLPPALAAVLLQMQRDYPDLGDRLDDLREAPDFAVQVRDLARILGYSLRGYLGENP